MGSRTEESSYEIYKKKFSKRETWRRFIDEVDATDLPAVSHVKSELQTCTNEKEEMQKLNNRLSDYIKKVQHLENRNKTLETQVNNLKSSSSSVDGVYQKEMKDLRIKLEKREEIVSELSLDLQQLQTKFENESVFRKNAEVQLEKFKTAERQATDKCNKMEKHVDTLVQELEFQEKVIKELSKPQKSLEWEKEKDEQMQAFEKKETEYKTQMETNKTEIETLQKTKFSLEKKQQEMYKQHKKYEEKIEMLESEVSTTTTKMNQQLSAYQNLLNVKIKLDEEIEEYRKLLDGGEKEIKSHSPPVPPKDQKDPKEGNNPKSGGNTPIKNPPK